VLLSAAIDTRVPATRQKKGQTIGPQTAAWQAHAGQLGAELSEERVYEGSGATLVRPAPERLRDLIGRSAPRWCCATPGPPRHGRGRRQRGTRPASSPPRRGPAALRPGGFGSCLRAGGSLLRQLAVVFASAAREGLVPAGLSGVDPLAGLGACLPDGGVRLPFGAVIRPRTIG